MRLASVSALKKALIRSRRPIPSSAGAATGRSAANPTEARSSQAIEAKNNCLIVVPPIGFLNCLSSEPLAEFIDRGEFPAPLLSGVAGAQVSAGRNLVTRRI